MGRGVSRIGQRRWYGEMATSERGPGAGEHHLHTGFAGVRVPYHGLQFTGGQNSGRTTRPTW